MNEQTQEIAAHEKAIAGRRHVTLYEARALPIPAGNLAAPALAHGSMVLEYYAPDSVDNQSPHSRDELYLVVTGSGWFANGAERHRFRAGDAIFVPAGVVHRFEDFTGDFSTWVIFYGPEGGEAPTSACTARF